MESPLLRGRRAEMLGDEFRNVRYGGDFEVAATPSGLVATFIVWQEF